MKTYSVRLDNTFKLHISSPDGKEFIEYVEMANFVLTDGAIGIMKDHTPLVGILDISHMSYLKGGKYYYFAISGGVLSVKRDEVLVLADTFESKDEIDVIRVTKSKEDAESILNSNDENADLKKAELKLKRALNRLSLLSEE